MAHPKPTSGTSRQDVADADRASAPSAAMPLTAAQTRFLRGQAHDLKALLQVGGKGVSEALVAEVDGALEHHELIKVKIAGSEREARDAMIAELARRPGGAQVQRNAHTPVRYRPSEYPRRIVQPRT
jgi:RNA-binding protein